LEHLPFEDRFKRSIWSRLLIHSNRHPPLDLDVSRYPLVENPVSYDTLVDVDESGTIIPVLAEKWETPDSKTYVLYLKQGLKFSDGTDFDGEAVKFNIDRHLDPKTASKQRGVLLSVDSIDVPDKYTVRFHLKAPHAAFLSIFFDRVGFMPHQPQSRSGATRTTDCILLCRALPARRLQA
jgi:ABC-type transport system substrate-binding protein